MACQIIFYLIFFRMCLKQKEVNTCSFRKPVERIMNARYSRYKRNRLPSYRWMCDHDEAPRRSTVLSSLIYTNNKKHQPFRLEIAPKCRRWKGCPWKRVFVGSDHLAGWCVRESCSGDGRLLRCSWRCRD